jgi:hypothetical protein
MAGMKKRGSRGLKRSREVQQRRRFLAAGAKYFQNGSCQAQEWNVGRQPYKAPFAGIWISAEEAKAKLMESLAAKGKLSA